MLNRYISILALVVAMFATGATQAASVNVVNNSMMELSQYNALSWAVTSHNNTSDTATVHQKTKFVVEQSATDITPVPVPAAAWLFVSGVLGLLTVSRRKKQQRD